MDKTIKKQHVTNNSGNNEWYTPLEYIVAARTVMGDIDLDPASSPAVNRIIMASTFYTELDNGLDQQWNGRVWMNPPYSRKLIGKFIDKLVKHVTDGDITQAIVLVNNATDTMWFLRLVTIASAICFVRGRVGFWSPYKTSRPLQGQAVVYIGENHKKFKDAYCNFGWIAIVDHITLTGVT